MTHAEICPVCGGRGLVFGEGYIVSDYYAVCHSCGGIGWVTVPDDTVSIQRVSSWDEISRLEKIVQELSNRVEELKKKVIEK